jgi:hypothetical protein
MGELALARKHLTIALENSNTPAERKLYAERLETLGPMARTSRGRESVR